MGLWGCYLLRTLRVKIAISGMGKTAVFVLATLQQLEPVEGQISVLILCHTRELAFQISKEYERFAKYMANLKTAVFFGGVSIKKDQEALKQVFCSC